MTTVKVRVEQAGGKYGFFTCPVCGGRADYKFTGDAGWCDSCDSTFNFTDGADVCIDSVLGEFGPHLMEFEVNTEQSTYIMASEEVKEIMKKVRVPAWKNEMTAVTGYKKPEAINYESLGKVLHACFDAFSSSEKTSGEIIREMDSNLELALFVRRQLWDGEKLDADGLEKWLTRRNNESVEGLCFSSSGIAENNQYTLSRCSGFLKPIVETVAYKSKNNGLLQAV